jgi:outer membrane biosynthesis protein TonB
MFYDDGQEEKRVAKPSVMANKVPDPEPIKLPKAPKKKPHDENNAKQPVGQKPPEDAKKNKHNEKVVAPALQKKPAASTALVGKAPRAVCVSCPKPFNLTQTHTLSLFNLRPDARLPSRMPS